MILSPAGAPHSHGGLYPALFSALLCSFRRSIVCSHGTAKPAGFFLLWKNRRSTSMGLPPRPSGGAESSHLAAGGPAAQEACARRRGSIRSPGNHWFLSYTFFFKNAIVLFSRCINFRWDFLSPSPLNPQKKRRAPLRVRAVQPGPDLARTRVFPLSSSRRSRFRFRSRCQSRCRRSSSKE